MLRVGDFCVNSFYTYMSFDKYMYLYLTDIYTNVPVINFCSHIKETNKTFGLQMFYRGCIKIMNK